MNMFKTMGIAAVFLAAGAGGAYWYATVGREWLAQRQAAAPAVCEKHHLSREKCPFCDKTLIEKLGECGEHGVPEALCWKCRPKLVAAFKIEKDWCAEHDCPESLCALCGHGPATAHKETDAKPKDDCCAKKEKEDAHEHGEGDGHQHDKEDEHASEDGHNHEKPHHHDHAKEMAALADVPRHQRPPSDHCATGKQPVKLASADIARRAGLKSVAVERRAIAHDIPCNIELTYNANRFARFSSRAAGVVREVKKDLGDRVAAGDVLAVIDSADLAAAKAEFLQLLATVQRWESNQVREQDLLGRGLSTKRDMLETETKLAEGRIALTRAKQRLKAFGLDETAVENVIQTRETEPLLPVVATLPGIVVERAAVVGESVDTLKPLFAVADTSDMWAMLDVHETTGGQVRAGQTVQIEIDGTRGATRNGQITWVSTELDHKTRTLKARAALDNADGALRANLFGRGRIAAAEHEPLLVVPKTAVQWDGCCNLVFVRQDETLYEPRKVRLGHETDEWIEVESGLTAGEQVVTQGSFLLKTEIMKESIGAGCCPDD